jgi:polyhydroxyalkanoate synthesis regulator phasin
MSWYILSKFRFVEMLFDWIRSGDLRKAKGIMLDFRKKNGVRLVDEDILHRYSRGSAGKIDALFMQAKLQHENREVDQLPGTMRHIETALAEERIEELEKKIRDIESGTVSGTGRQLVKTYQNLILSYTKKMADYDDAFHKKFPGQLHTES